MSLMWEEALARDSLLDILARYIHLEAKERQIRTDKGVRTVRKESMIFPRYHQLKVVRKLVEHAHAKGSGHNYLVQHSAGSGKSNSIAWLAHHLAGLHDDKDQKVFDSVIVITDRLILDQQLQDTIYQFEHKRGVVEKIDEDTQQLAKALADRVPIVISTIQKFPFIAGAINTMAKKGETVAIDTAGRRFAVIVDEAHSSSAGETAQALRGILNKEGIEAAVAAQILDEEEDSGLTPEARENMLRDMAKRPRQPNLSYFAFTATPKFKTKAIFDEPGDDGRSPFHLGPGSVKAGAGRATSAIPKPKGAGCADAMSILSIAVTSVAPAGPPFVSCTILTWRVQLRRDVDCAASPSPADNRLTSAATAPAWAESAALVSLR
jgi:type I restriction enzyme R subunit